MCHNVECNCLSLLARRVSFVVCFELSLKKEVRWTYLKTGEIRILNVRVPDPTTTVALPVDDHTSETSGIEESDIHSTPEGVSYMDRRRSMGWCSSSDIVESSRSGSS